MGVQSLCATVHLSNFPLGPPLRTQETFVTSITCLFLATAGLSLLTGYGRRQEGVALAVVLGTRAAAVYLWKIFILTHQSGPWTATAELAVLSAASLEVAVSYNTPIGAESLNRVGLRPGYHRKSGLRNFLACVRNSTFYVRQIHCWVDSCMGPGALCRWSRRWCGIHSNRRRVLIRKAQGISWDRSSVLSRR
jgi:hypothetical protein